MTDETRDHGTQPLDLLLQRWGLDNHRLVEASTEQLSHKQVQKARKGRQLTLHMMMKTTRALNTAAIATVPKERRGEYTEYLHRQVFTYAKGHDPAWADPNESLAAELAAAR